MCERGLTVPNLSVRQAAIRSHRSRPTSRRYRKNGKQPSRDRRMFKADESINRAKGIVVGARESLERNRERVDLAVRIFGLVVLVRCGEIWAREGGAPPTAINRFIAIARCCISSRATSYSFRFQ